MKALTLWNPWAQLIALGEKKVETRPWAPPSTMSIGEQFAICSAATFPWTHKDWMTRWPFNDALAKHGITADNETHVNMPRGCVVAVATLAAVERTEQSRKRVSDQELEFGNYEDGRFAWWLRDVIRLPEPVPCRGYQKMWRLPANVEAAVREQVAA